jgi:hypothetical protein
VNPITKTPLAVQEGTEDEEDFLDAEEEIRTVKMTKMPDPYARDAPKFHHDRPEELNRFIKRVEELFKTHDVKEDKDKIRYLGSYADPKTENEWEGMHSYAEGTFADFKKEIIESYPEASNQTRGSIKELKRIRDQHSGITPWDISRLAAFKRAFIAEVKKLQKPPALLSNHESVEYFMKPLTDSYRKMIENKLDLAEMVSEKEVDKERRPEDRFSLERVMEVAWNIATGSQANNTRSYSDQETERTTRNSGRVKFEGDQIENMIANLQDQQKISEKSWLGKLDEINRNFEFSRQAIQNMQKQAAFAHQAPMPAPMQNYPSSYQTQMSAPRIMNRIRPFSGANGNACFYCSEEGHMRDECPHRAKHLQDGLIVVDDSGRTVLPDGKPIPITGGPTQKARIEALYKVAVRLQDLVLAHKRPGVIQLSQALPPRPKIQKQTDIEDDLAKFDLNDLVQYVATRSGKGITVEEEVEEGFN